MALIEVNNLTKDYGHGRGVFNISAHVDKGECFGFLGPNGAGKSTTIRHLMGFSKPQTGSTFINGRDSWKNAAELQNTVGYLPGEIAMPDRITGTEFLDMTAKMREMSDRKYLDGLLKRFELDPNIRLKQMSLGTKRKLAVVTAFMHDPEILILDEPTSGLDPIMQQIFIDFILEEKKRGKTIFLSSHIFHEVDASCDRIAIIRDGVIVSDVNPQELKDSADKIYRFTFRSQADFEKFTSENYNFTSINKKKMRVWVCVENSKINSLIADISAYDIADFIEVPFTLEDYFMHFYKEDKEFKGVS